MTSTVTMEIRSVQPDARTITGVVAPYDELTYLVGDPNGERIRRGAFSRSIKSRGDRVPLIRGHDRDLVLGVSRAFREDPDGLVGEFVVNPGDAGDRLLDDVRQGYLRGMSVGFLPVKDGVIRGDDGAREVREARLVEVSLVGIPAYEGAGMLAVRSAQDTDALFAPFRDIPKWDLDPVPVFDYRPR